MNKMIMVCSLSAFVALSASAASEQVIDEERVLVGGYETLTAKNGKSKLVVSIERVKKGFKRPVQTTVQGSRSTK